MPTIKCKKCGTEFEVTEKEAAWMTVCRPCYAKSQPFKKASEMKANGREDCIMRQVAIKALAATNDLDFDGEGKLTEYAKSRANSLFEYMKKG